MSCKKINIQVNEAIGSGTGSYDLVGSNGSKIFRGLHYSDLGTTFSGPGITFSVNTNNISYTFSNYNFPSETNCDECNCVYEDTRWWKNSDATAHSNSGINYTDAKIQSDEKVVVISAGTFGIGTQSWTGRIVRFNSDGSLDSSFKSNIGLTGFSGGSVFAITIQQDDKIIIGGASNLLFNGTQSSITRFNTDGTIDSSFKSNVRNIEQININAIIEDSNNRLIFGGGFTGYNGNIRNRIFKLNSDGTEYTTFNTNIGTGFNSTVTAMVGTTTSVIIGGQFTSLNGITRNRIVKINDDGTEDTTFYSNLLGATGSGLTGNINTLVRQDDGKIILIGTSFVINGNSRSFLIRLNPDGTEDTLFYSNLLGATGSGFNSTVKNVVHKNGKLIVNGNFTSFNSKTRYGIVRLNEDGTEDITYYNFLSADGIYAGTSRFTLSNANKVVSYGNYLIYFQLSSRMYINTMARGIIKIIDEC